MPIPLLIGIGVVVGGALAIGNVAGREVNEELELDLYSINRKIERLPMEANEKHKQAVDSLNENISELNQFKQIIQTTVILPYCKAFEKIHNITYQIFTNSNDYITERNNLEEVHALVKEGDVMWGAEKVVTNIGDGVFSVLMPGAGGMLFVGKVIKGVNLMNKIDEAKEQLAMVELECEKMNIETDLINDTINKIKELRQVLEAITPLLNRATIQIQNSLKKFGSNYSDWDLESQSLLWTSINIAAGMNKIITTPVINDSGKINPAFVKVVEQARVLPEGKSMDDTSSEKNDDSMYACGTCFQRRINGGAWDVFIYNPKYGDKKTGIPAGTDATQIDPSWRCPYCNSSYKNMFIIPAGHLPKEEIKKQLACIESNKDYYIWISGMLLMTESEILSFDPSERHQRVRDEIRRIESCYDDETLNEAGKTYGRKIKNMKWSDRLDRDWIRYTYIDTLIAIKESQIKFLRYYV